MDCIEIPENVIINLEEVRSSGACNMFDSQCVLLELYNMNHYGSVSWLLDPEKINSSSQVDIKKYSSALKELGNYKKMIKNLKQNCNID